MVQRQERDSFISQADLIPVTAGQRTSFIKNKVVRSEKYNKLRHEAKRDKKKARKVRFLPAWVAGSGGRDILPLYPLP